MGHGECKDKGEGVDKGERWLSYLIYLVYLVPLVSPSPL